MLKVTMYRARPIFRHRVLYVMYVGKVDAVGVSDCVSIVSIIKNLEGLCLS